MNSVSVRVIIRGNPTLAPLVVQLSRVPCIGEEVVVGGVVFDVMTVCHHEPDEHGLVAKISVRG